MEVEIPKGANMYVVVMATMHYNESQLWKNNTIEYNTIHLYAWQVKRRIGDCNTR